MFIGKVVGTVWATKKTTNVETLRFLIIHPINLDKPPNTNVVVAADILGAGPGELVLVAFGRAARLAIGNENASIEAAVIGIIDSIEVDHLEFRAQIGNLEEAVEQLNKIYTELKKKDKTL